MPTINIKEDIFTVWKMKMVKAGYGDIKTINEIDIKTFFDIIHYENYLVDYSNAFKELNNGRK